MNGSPSRSRRYRFLAAVAAVGVVLLAAAAVPATPDGLAVSGAQPEPPHRFFGTVNTTDGTPVSGATVSVVYRGDVVARDKTNDEGFYDLKVPADQIDEEANRTLVLTVRDTSKTRQFESGGSERVNFVVGGPATTATVTDTPAQTETQTQTDTETPTETATETETSTETETKTETETETTTDSGSGGGQTTRTTTTVRTTTGTVTTDATVTTTGTTSTPTTTTTVTDTTDTGDSTGTDTRTTATDTTDTAATTQPGSPGTTATTTTAAGIELPGGFQVQLPGFGFGPAVVAVVLAAILALRRRRT